MMGRPPTLNKGLGKSSDKGRKRVPVHVQRAGSQLLVTGSTCDAMRDDERTARDVPLEGPPIKMTAFAEGVAISILCLAEYTESETFRVDPDLNLNRPRRR